MRNAPRKFAGQLRLTLRGLAGHNERLPNIGRSLPISRLAVPHARLLNLDVAQRIFLLAAEANQAMEDVRYRG